MEKIFDNDFGHRSQGGVIRYRNHTFTLILSQAYFGVSDRWEEISLIHTIPYQFIIVKNPLLVAPAGIEPASSESESEILSIEIRSQFPYFDTKVKKAPSGQKFILMAHPIKALHANLLSAIILKSGKPTQHTFKDNYLGNSHPRYPISNPVLRATTRTWLRTNPLSPKEFLALATSLVQAPSSTEKMTAGILLDYASEDQLAFDPKIYERWLNHLVGWAEVDTLCYGHFNVIQVMDRWGQWKKVLLKLNKSKNINKRRASLVMLCKPLTRTDDKRVHTLAFQLVDQLKSEKEVLITKAVSWTLRSMAQLHRVPLTRYITKNNQALPAIAVRETLAKLKTGRKTKKPD